MRAGSGTGRLGRLGSLALVSKAGKEKLDWNNLGGHEPARFRVVGQVLDAPERLREVVEALS